MRTIAIPWWVLRRMRSYLYLSTKYPKRSVSKVYLELLRKDLEKYR